MTKSRYTQWWLALPVEEKDRLRAKARERSLEVLTKIIQRAGVTNDRSQAVTAVLDVTCRQLFELATDIECVVAYEIAQRETVDAGSGI